MKSGAILLVLVTTTAAGCASPSPTAPLPRDPRSEAAAAQAVDASPPPPAGARPAWASAYPATRVVSTSDTLFGTEVRDPYRWLEDGKSDEVRAWMRAEDALTRQKLGAAAGRAALVARLRELLYVDSQGIPSERGGRLFYWRRSGAQEKWVMYWRPRSPAHAGASADEHVLLDPNTWSKDGSVAVHTAVPSWDGKRVAYTVSENNSDEATLHVIDVDSGKVSTGDVITGAMYAEPSWTPQGDGFYYVHVPVDSTIPADTRPGWADLRLHRLGADPAKDLVVRPKTGDPTKSLSGAVSRDGHWLVSTIESGWSATDVYLRDLRAGASATASAWLPLVVGRDARYDVHPFRDRLYVWTNEGAPNGRVFVVDPAHSARAAWREIVPERPDATLSSMRIVGGALALEYLKDVTTRLELRDLVGAPLRAVALPGLGTASRLAGNEDGDEAYYSFESYDRPHEIHATSVKRGGDTTIVAEKVPFDASRYQVEQIFFTSKDGTRVPMFVMHARGMTHDGKAPALMTGYGGFNIPETPWFESSAVPFLERGGVVVDVTLRGGGEYGEKWHRAGMRHEKQHVFDDFIGAAEALVQGGFTSPDRLVIHGGSNGGLLMGAVLTQRPDLFRAVICGVPLLDMVRYQRFGEGRTWIDEYGSAEKEEDFRTLFAYSPYHHVQAGTAYPSVLFDSSDSDDRVDPLHARKMTAALQAASTGGPVLLRIEEHAGHGGADLQRAWVERLADRYAFIFAELARTGTVMSAP